MEKYDLMILSKKGIRINLSQGTPKVTFISKKLLFSLFIHTDDLSKAPWDCSFLRALHGSHQRTEQSFLDQKSAGPTPKPIHSGIKGQRAMTVSHGRWQIGCR